MSGGDILLVLGGVGALAAGAIGIAYYVKSGASPQAPQPIATTRDASVVGKKIGASGATAIPANLPALPQPVQQIAQTAGLSPSAIFQAFSSTAASIPGAVAAIGSSGDTIDPPSVQPTDTSSAFYAAAPSTYTDVPTNDNQGTSLAVDSVGTDYSF